MRQVLSSAPSFAKLGETEKKILNKEEKIKQNMDTKGLGYHDQKTYEKARAFRIDVVDSRPDGLVFSSDGKNVLIQKGLDETLESLADSQLDPTDEVDTEDMRSEAELAVMAKRLSREIADQQIEDILRDSQF